MDEFAGICGRCKKRPACTELCAPVEAYVSQDEVHLRELPIGPAIESVPDVPPAPAEEDMDRKRRILHLYFRARHTQEEVANQVRCHKSYVSKVVRAEFERMGV